MNELLPCAHCGAPTGDAGPRIVEQGHIRDALRAAEYYIRCFGCGMMTPSYHDKTEVIELWNRRADDKYRQAEAEGRLVVLPVKIKDVVFIHDESGSIKPMSVEHMQSAGTEIVFSAECMDQTEYCNCGHSSCCAIRFSALSMQERIFLTREEAEAALNDNAKV